MVTKDCTELEDLKNLGDKFQTKLYLSQTDWREAARAVFAFIRSSHCGLLNSILESGPENNAFRAVRSSALVPSKLLLAEEKPRSQVRHCPADWVILRHCGFFISLTLL